MSDRLLRSTGTVRWAIGVTGGVAVAIAVALVWSSFATQERSDLPSSGRGGQVTTSTTRAPRGTTTTTRLPAEPIDVDELPGSSTTVLATEHGVLVFASDASGGAPPLRRLTDEAADTAFGVGRGRVVIQEAHGEGSGRIVVIDGLAVHEVFPAVEIHGGERHFRLLDAGMVRGRPVAVIRAFFDVRGPGDGDDERLLLLDLETLRRTDLGAGAGWEERVGGARLLSDGDVVIHRVGTGGDALERRRGDGTTAWSVSLPDQGSAVLATSPGGADAPPHAVLVHLRGPEEIDVPDLFVQRFDLRDGREAGTTPVAISVLPAGDAVRSPCSRVEATRTSLLCDESWTGQVLRISLVDGTATRVVDLPNLPGSGSFATTWRR